VVNGREGGRRPPGPVSDGFERSDRSHRDFKRRDDEMMRRPLMSQSIDPPSIAPNVPIIRLRKR